MTVALAARVPLRGDFPAGAGEEAVPVSGGIPFPRGQLKSVGSVRLLGTDGKEIACQVTRLAVWPDGSVKWALIDAVLPPSAAEALAIEYGAGVQRSPVPDPITAGMRGRDAEVDGGGVGALISRSGGGVLDALSYGERIYLAPDRPARLVVNALRIADGTSGKALPAHQFVCRDTGATLDVGKVSIDEITVESEGPIRATIRIRGHVLLPRFGSTLPQAVKRREPAGRLPFTTRLSFFRGCRVVHGQHQIVFSGEPDCDYLARWSIQLRGRASARGSLALEPGVALDQVGDQTTIPTHQTRLCWAPIREGFALVRKGWQNRPCAITHGNGDAWIDFWPEAAGVWDLRRYAREWACGESGNTKDARSIRRYAKWAARGLAKSHDFVIYLGGTDPTGAAPAIVRALSDRALLLAPPAWYAQTQALGAIAPEQTSGPLAALDAGTRREIDYHLYCQDLFRWHGKLEYGNWQTRFGVIHRHDRWDRDYGRWAWALNDGAGRIGHMLMLQFLRTLERRYFDAGEAFNRANYDTNMVHTVLHLENTRNWWTATGCSHRHGVQPFSCPYIGMRGSNPGGQRILHLLTGDGVIADGLGIVAEASYKYITGHGSRLCNSGGSDGQGSASNALLWKYETAGDRKYLDACRKILERSGLIPPKPGARLGYAPSFGLFNAAGEYAELSGDQTFRQHMVELARQGAKQKRSEQFLYAIALGHRLSGDGELRAKLEAILKRLADAYGSSLSALPVSRWPGHAGWRTPKLNANATRDYPYAIAAIMKPDSTFEWPARKPNAKPVPARPPEDWYRPGGLQAADERVPPAEGLLKLSAHEGQGKLVAGQTTWTAQTAIANNVTIRGATPLAGSITPYVTLMAPKEPGARLASSFEVHRPQSLQVGTAEDASIVAVGSAGPARLAARMRVATVDGAPSVRIEMAGQVKEGGRRVAGWGLLVPLRLGRNPHAIQTTAPGRFRLERCRLDQNDERIPNWLTSEYHFGEGAPLWPKWRLSGIDLGPGPFYRIWRANRKDTSPLFCDQGEGKAAWFDITDRGGRPRWGLTVRMLRRTPIDTDASRMAVRADLETGLLEVQFHDAAAPPLPESAAATGLAGAADFIFHDGWRPPLSKPELTPEQYGKFIDDLNYGENYGLCALRFRLSITHKVRGRQWMAKIRDLGIEPREILYGMQWRDGLARHCQRLGVRCDPSDLEGSVRRVIRHYRKR